MILGFLSIAIVMLALYVIYRLSETPQDRTRAKFISYGRRIGRLSRTVDTLNNKLEAKRSELESVKDEFLRFVQKK